MSYTAEELEAVQRAVERVGANWDAAPEETIEDHLRGAIAEVGVEVPPEEVRALAEAIDEERGIVDVGTVLTSGDETGRDHG